MQEVTKNFNSLDFEALKFKHTEEIKRYARRVRSRLGGIIRSSEIHAGE